MNTGINGSTNVEEVLTFWEPGIGMCKVRVYVYPWPTVLKKPKEPILTLDYGSQETQRTDSEPRLTVLKKPKEPALTLGWRFSRNPKSWFWPLSDGSQGTMPKNLPWIDGSFTRSPTYLLTYLPTFVMFSKTRNWKFLFDSEKVLKIKIKIKLEPEVFQNSEKFQTTGIWGFLKFYYLLLFVIILFLFLKI